MIPIPQNDLPKRTTSDVCTLLRQRLAVYQPPQGARWTALSRPPHSRALLKETAHASISFCQIRAVYGIVVRSTRKGLLRVSIHAHRPATVLNISAFLGH